MPTSFRHRLAGCARSERSASSFFRIPRADVGRLSDGIPAGGRIDFVARLLENGKLESEHDNHILVHRIEAEEETKPLGAPSKMNAEWNFLRHLFDVGRLAADEWIGNNFDDLDKRSTVDIQAMFQG